MSAAAGAEERHMPSCLHYTLDIIPSAMCIQLRLDSPELGGFSMYSAYLEGSRSFCITLRSFSCCLYECWNGASRSGDIWMGWVWCNVCGGQISCAFVVDALEALSGTCGLYLSTSGRRYASHAACDLWVPLLSHALHLKHHILRSTYLSLMAEPDRRVKVVFPKRHDIFMIWQECWHHAIYMAYASAFFTWTNNFLWLQVACCTAGRWPGGHAGAGAVPQCGAHLPIHDLLCRHELQTLQRHHCPPHRLQLRRDQGWLYFFCTSPSDMSRNVYLQRF